MKTTIHVPDIECESCEKVLRKALNQPGITHLAFESATVTITHDNKTTANDLIKLIQNKGYRASLNEPARPSWHSHIGDVERLMIKHVLKTITIILALQAVYAFSFHNTEWAIKHGPWLALLTIVSTSICAALWHLKSYRATITCMTGMMLGMILGMQAGMMIGYILAITTTFPIGMFAGTITGMLTGYLAGRCCGTMGGVQGLMAGFMGGAMGPMISVMLIGDGFWQFTPWFFTANLAMLWTFSIILIENVIADKPGLKRAPVDFATFAAYTIILTAILTAICVLGPTGPMVM